MSVKLGDISERCDNVSGIVQDDSRARTGHAARGDERIEIVRQLEHIDLLLGILSLESAFDFEVLAGLENLSRRAARNDRLEFASILQTAPEFRIINKLTDGYFTDLDFIITRFFYMTA